MGLDVYVGPLSRYYAGALETDDPLIARQRVVEWQSDLSDVLMGSVGRLAWAESPTDDYVTDKLGWGPFVAVCLLAARFDGLQDRVPEAVPTAPRAMKLWGRLGRRTQAAEPLGHRIGRLLGRSSTYAPPPRRFTQIVGPEIWLPLDASVVIETADALGVRRTFGSIGMLLAELRQLNAQTYRASDETLSEWARKAPDDDAFEPAAQFGLAVMLKLAAVAVDRRQPLVLDY
jgi:hypothetical protein